jgi:Rad3-related DNA helicase
VTTAKPNPFAVAKPRVNPFLPAPPRPVAQVVPLPVSVTTVKSPAEIGFDQVRGWRSGQAELLENLLDWYQDSSRPRVMLLQAPTGWGKSLVAAAMATILVDQGLESMITTPTVKLQTQYIEEVFPEVSPALTAWGRNKHDCLIVPATTVDNAPCQYGLTCDEKSRCTYFVEKDAAGLAPIAVLNSMFWLTLCNYVDEDNNPFDRRALAIHDEAHQLESSVRSMVSATLSRGFFRRLNIKLPKGRAYIDWRDWLLEYMEQVSALGNEYARRVRADPQLDDREGKAAHRAAMSMRRIHHDILPNNPLISHQKNYVKFEPIWAAPFTQEKLFDHADKTLLMSGTLDIEYTSEMLGLADGEFESIDLDSKFEPMRRRVVYDPVIKVTGKTTQAEFLKLVQHMDNVIDGHPDQRGIIHTVSYKRAEHVMAMSRHRDRMFTHAPGNTAAKRDAIDEVIFSENGILVSPSVGVGEDFGRGDNVRFQCFVKYPIPYLGDAVVKARADGWKDSLWKEADQAFTQAVGRGMRSENDYCVNYLFDQGAGWRLPYLPAFMQESIIHRS